VAGGLAALGPLSLAQGAARPAAAAPRFVFVILRGGMDGLTAVPAVGDPAFAEAGRAGQFAGEVPCRCTALSPCIRCCRNCTRCTAAASWPCCTRWACPTASAAHFDAQQVLESRRQPPARADHRLAGPRAGRRGGRSAPIKAVALETAVPLVLRGPVEVDTWAPSALPEPGPDLVARLETLYRTTPAGARPWLRARSLRAEPGMAGTNRRPAGPPGRTGAGAQGGEFLQRGSQVAVLETGRLGLARQPGRAGGAPPATCARWTPPWPPCTRPCWAAGLGSAAWCWWPPSSAARWHQRHPGHRPRQRRCGLRCWAAPCAAAGCWRTGPAWRRRTASRRS
jgi:uncharacterized protein (DUF1501 family)